MRKTVKGVVGIVCSDIHLSHKCPVARSVEPDWYYAMARPLLEIDRLREVYGGVPVVCAGDIFDHWKSPPELINFAIDYLPNGMYSIPGQHDLPFHSLDDIKKSAYWTLVHTQSIINLPARSAMHASANLRLWGFPWNVPVELEKDDVHPEDVKYTIGDGPIRLAVIHAYNWRKGHSYPGAPVEGGCIRWQKKTKLFDASVFGDNHKGFMFGKNMMNCGTLMRRKIDEKKYQPQVGLITKWGKIIPHYLDTSEDLFIDEKDLTELAEKTLEVGQLVTELSGLGDKGLDFMESVKRYCTKNGIDKAVRRIILEAMEIK